jgi:hypothetical protein
MHTPTEKQWRIIAFIERTYNGSVKFDVNGDQSPYDFIGEYHEAAQIIHDTTPPDLRPAPAYDGTQLRADEWGGIPNF